MLQDDPRTEVDPPPVSATESKVADYEEKINRVRMKVNVSTPSVLVLTQIHYPGWRASIDGRSAPVLQTDYAFTGTLVGTGSHEIEFRFMPPTFVVGAAISLATVLAMILGWRASRRRGHRNVVH